MTHGFVKVNFAKKTIGCLKTSTSGLRKPSTFASGHSARSTEKLQNAPETRKRRGKEKDCVVFSLCIIPCSFFSFLFPLFPSFLSFLIFFLFFLYNTFSLNSSFYFRLFPLFFSPIFFSDAAKLAPSCCSRIQRLDFVVGELEGRGSDVVLSLANVANSGDGRRALGDAPSNGHLTATWLR